MKHWPLPIVVISSLVEGRCDTSLKALELGAVEVFPKPDGSMGMGMKGLVSQIAGVLLSVSGAKVKPKSLPARGPVTHILKKTTDMVIAIGASTGGTEAIRAVLEPLPAGTPGIVIVQHMPPAFTKAFAGRLNGLCQGLDVREARDGDSLRPGLALLAPGGSHIYVKRTGGHYAVTVKRGEPVCRHQPSVEVLFNSVAESAGENAVGVILTGMGHDGADGMANMRTKGARTVAQDKESCVVYGMPGEAVKRGAVEKILPISEIAPQVLRFLNERKL